MSVAAPPAKPLRPLTVGTLVANVANRHPAMLAHAAQSALGSPVVTYQGHQIDFSRPFARLTITEGRYHQVRRMFAAMGNHVEALHRDRIGGLELRDRGAVADLRDGDVLVIGQMAHQHRCSPVNKTLGQLFVQRVGQRLLDGFRRFQL